MSEFKTRFHLNRFTNFQSSFMSSGLPAIPSQKEELRNGLFRLVELGQACTSSFRILTLLFPFPTKPGKRAWMRLCLSGT